MWARLCWSLGHDNRQRLAVVLVLVLEGWAGLVQGASAIGRREAAISAGRNQTLYHRARGRARARARRKKSCCLSRHREAAADPSAVGFVFLRREAATYFSIATNRLAAELRSGSTISGTGANGKSWAPGREMKAARQPAQIAPATSQP